MSVQQVRISKFLSLVLRHEPAKAGIVLDSAGWVEVDALLRGCAAAGVSVSREELEQVVAQSDKQRFAFSDDRRSIRANQGHSVEVQLDYAPMVPPDILFHGTAERFLATIRLEGLNKRQRHHVHLSAERAVAVEVGRRHGRPVVLVVAAAEMHAAGHAFFRSANGVWLTESVPVAFLREEQA
ncbi:MAG: RNA 2'-phosphotransferase [Verrucomicrobiota bacterium]